MDELGRLEEAEGQSRGETSSACWLTPSVSSSRRLTTGEVLALRLNGRSGVGRGRSVSPVVSRSGSTLAANHDATHQPAGDLTADTKANAARPHPLPLLVGWVAATNNTTATAARAWEPCAAVATGGEV